MRFVMFYHSLVSDWNHGNAHFLRGIVTELLARGHQVRVLEPELSWSRQNLVREYGAAAEAAFHEAYPGLASASYNLETLNLDRELADADVVLVHEWNDHALVAALGRHRARHGGYRLFFHDTHHRSVTEPQSMAAYRLESYDGVLAFGEVIRERYLEEGWSGRVWTWHEAADDRVFYPRVQDRVEGDVIWVGNWGDEERTSELEEFLFNPVEQLRLRARVYGVRYPAQAKERLARAGIEYAGWLPNHEVPSAFARFRLTLHIPRRPYVDALPGIPTIRVFEALACGLPLICSPWWDAEHLFTPGKDYFIASNGAEMKDCIATLLSDSQAANAMAQRGRATILARHTCRHRVDELMEILEELNEGAVISQSARRASVAEVS